MSHEQPKDKVVESMLGFDAKKYIKELGIEEGEVYEFEPNEGGRFYARLQLRTLGTKPGEQRIILECEDGTTAGITDTKTFKAVNRVDAETRKRVMGVIEGGSDADAWYG